LKPAFATLLAADGWLPDACAQPDEKSRMGGGIGQYALYRAEDGTLCLFSLVVPAGAATPVHDHLAWGLVGIYRGRQDGPSTGGSTMAAIRHARSWRSAGSRRSIGATSTRSCRRPMTFTT
jgi:hypothetical protein